MVVSGSVDHGQHEQRLGRVETDLDGVRSQMGVITQDVGSLKSDVRGLGSILERIERGVLHAQEKSEDREVAGRPNLVAVVSVLITIVSILVGGAWLIGGQLATLQARTQEFDRDRTRYEHKFDQLDTLTDRSQARRARSSSGNPPVDADAG